MVNVDSGAAGVKPARRLRHFAPMTFDVAADSYDRFMGVYSTQLAPQLVGYAGVRPGHRVLDVGSGPGALTAELVRLLGTDAVAAVDPSEPFVEAARTRQPGLDVRPAPAEDLPFADDEFDAALAQLVVHFMADPVAGLREMARVTRPGGVVAACVWDLAGGRAPVSPFWRAALELDPDARDESGLSGVGEGHLLELFRAAGLREVEEAEVSATVAYETFDDWWEPFMLGVGPAGAHVRALGEDKRDELRERARARLPEPPFALTTHAWAARGRV
jgi:SAM-dependent methyltransferase